MSETVISQTVPFIRFNSYRTGKLLTSVSIATREDCLKKATSLGYVCTAADWAVCDMISVWRIA